MPPVTSTVKTLDRTRKAAQMVKCPVHKHQDLKSNPWHPCTFFHICDPDSGGWEIASSPKLAGQLVNPALDSVREPVPR